MPRPKHVKPLTEEEKFKLALQAEAELGRLHRQYAFLEKDRHLFTGGVKLAQLNHKLAIYQREHTNILTDLEVAGCSTKQREDARVADRLVCQLGEYDFYTQKVAQERQYIEEIETQIKITQKEVVKLRSMQITDRQHEERVWLAMKTIEALDNKLEVQMKKFGSICAELGELKLKINGLLWERELFLKMWKKMIDKLVLGKRFLLDLIEQATVAYDQREEWCSKLQALRLKAHQDFLNHTQHMRVLERRQDNNKKLEEFFAVKGQKRVMRDLHKKEEEKRQQIKEKLEAKKEQFTHLMDEILEFTKEPQVKVIAEKFCIQEAENFSRFNYVNDLIKEMEMINDRLGNVYIEIEERRAINETRSEDQKNTLEDLEHRLQEAKAEWEVSERTLNENNQHLQEMLDGIDKLFKICRCSNDPILDLLGDNTKVNTYNALLYLQLIEKKIHEVMLAVYYRNKTQILKKTRSSSQLVIKEEKTKPTIFTVDKMVPKSPCPLCCETEMVSDVIDTLQKVMTRARAKQKNQQRLSAPDADEAARVHNVSDCHLPKSREIIQKRYQ